MAHLYNTSFANPCVGKKRNSAPPTHQLFAPPTTFFTLGESDIYLEKAPKREQTTIQQCSKQSQAQRISSSAQLGTRAVLLCYFGCNFVRFWAILADSKSGHQFCYYR